MPPVLNITIPVFNRLEKTQLTILALRKTSQKIPFVITVVNNGSDPELSQRLMNFKNDGIIDNLLVLPRNMGIACAANVGWQLVDAPYYMKLDNDVIIKDKNWSSKIFNLWRHGEPDSTIGGAYNWAMLTNNPDYLTTEDGILGVCAATLPGHAIIIPKRISQVIGLWNEDYGLYGAEDGDYGVRMGVAGFKQYYYNTEDILTHVGVDDDYEYVDRGVIKQQESGKLFIDASGNVGWFSVNSFLFYYCLRELKVPLRYKIVDVQKNHVVILQEDPVYTEFRKGLEHVQRIMTRLNKAGKDLHVFEYMEKFKEIIQSCSPAGTSDA